MFEPFPLVRLCSSGCVCRPGSRHLESNSPFPPILFLLRQFFHCQPNARQRPILASLLMTPSHESRSKEPELSPEVATVRQEER